MPVSLLLLIAVSTGVSLGVFGDPSLARFASWVAALAGAAALAAIRHRSRELIRFAAATSLAAVSSVAGSSALDRAIHPPLRTLLEDRLGGFDIDGTAGARPQGPVLVEGRLRDDGAESEGGATLSLEVERVWVGAGSEAAAGGVSITVVGALASESLGEWRAGRRIRAPVFLRRPARYLNEGVPDQERALARRGVALVGTVKSGALIEVVQLGGPVDEAAGRVRAFVRRSIARHVGVHAALSGAIATAILIGDRTGLDQEVERRLQEAGTYHVIAISGGNIALLAGVALGLLWAMGVRGPWAAGVTMVLLLAYACVVTGGTSVARATIMASLYLLLRLIDQRTAPGHALALTGATLLLAEPLAIADVGSWLTFGATAAIVIGIPRTPRPPRVWLQAPVALVTASACAEIALMPVGALTFERVTLAGLVLNLAAVPCMGVVEVAAMVTVLCDAAGVGPVARLSGWVAHLAVRGLTESAALVDLAPWCTWRVPPPSLFAVGAYYLGLVVLWWATRPPVDTLVRRWSARAAATMSAGLFIWIAVAPPSLVRIHGDGRLHLTAMDVGQGDALLVVLPNGRRLMVDAGGVSTRGGFDVGDRVLGPALRARGIVGLDYLAFTHGDPDHIGGAPALVRQFSPAEIWEGVPVPSHEPTVALHQEATKDRAAWRTLQRGDRLELGGVELRIHHPRPPDWERQKVRNDDSLVIELRFGSVSMLLTGDIGQEVERAMLPDVDLLPIVVLKSPHHGSGTSSSAEFVAAIRPAVVLISCGRGNPYGHPVPYVLDRYHAIGAQVFRTDQDGQIDVATDGETVTVSSFTGRRETIKG